MNQKRPSPGTLSDAGRLSWPAELIALGFHLVMIWSVVAAMQRVDTDDRLNVLGPLATAGLLFGFLLARTRIQDLFAHSIAVWAGAVTSFVLVSIQIGKPSEIISTRAEVLRDLVTGVASSLSQIDSGPVADEQLLVVLGITSWLLAYSSAWVVYRRRWFTAGIGVPAAILLASIRVDNRNGGWELIMFIAGAIGLAARDSFAAFLQRWLRRGLAAPRGAATWFMASAIPIALVTVLLTSALNPAITSVERVNYSDQLDRVMNSAESTWDRHFGRDSGTASGYTEFPDEWDTDGDLDLSDQVVAYVAADQAPYLAARRYDEYTGRGWGTNVDETFSGSGTSNKPITNVTYTANNSVILSQDVSMSRREDTTGITVVAPTGDLMLTTGIFTGADRNVQTIMGWIQIPATSFDVENDSVDEIPADFRKLVSDAQGKPFSVDAESGKIVFDDPAVNELIAGEIERLAQFPVTVVFAVGENGQLLVTFSGQVPNYDDIEAIYFQKDVEPNDSYQTNGSVSSASPDALAAAGTDYPQWVRDRYLAPSDRITSRTREKAVEIAAQSDAQNPYAIARAIESWLHSSEFDYEANPPGLPAGEDLVDYFLFETKIGRCQHYASAMAVLLRSVGIPARIVLGYNASNEFEGSNGWVYRAEQAHSWVEVFFPGYGWVSFEPTPGFVGFGTDSEDQAPSTPVAATTMEATPDIEGSPEVLPTPTAESSPVPPVLSSQEQDDGNLRNLIIVLFAIGLALLAGIVGFMVISWNRGLGGLRPASGFFARLIKLGAWFGLQPTAATTPGEFARSFSRTVPGTETAVRSITEAYYIEQFNPAANDRESLARAEAGWKQLRRNLLRWRIRTPK